DAESHEDPAEDVEGDGSLRLLLLFGAFLFGRLLGLLGLFLLRVVLGIGGRKRVFGVLRLRGQGLDVFLRDPLRAVAVVADVLALADRALLGALAVGAVGRLAGVDQ